MAKKKKRVKDWAKRVHRAITKANDALSRKVNVAITGNPVRGDIVEENGRTWVYSACDGAFEPIKGLPLLESRTNERLYQLARQLMEAPLAEKEKILARLDECANALKMAREVLGASK